MVLVVFGVGLLSGAFFGRAGNIILNGLLGGVIGATLFLLGASILAVIVTAIQSIRPSSRGAFAPRFMRNLEGAMELLVQGWS
jgi:uncharacterized membrane protein